MKEMKFPLDWMLKSKHWSFTKIIGRYMEKVYSISVLRKVQMADKKEDESEAPPSKKLCLDKDNGTVQAIKIRYKKVAILLGYLGDNYYGMQVNTPVRTIEGELLSAIAKAGFIQEKTVTEPGSIKFQRTARTDKGVSAVKQVVSLQIAENYSVENINKYLPEDIKVFSVKKVTKGFNSKNDCTGRTYSYTLPTFALAPEFHSDYPEKYRINQEAMDKVNEILLSYAGTHNFHNFTIKKAFNDPSVKRFMMNVKAEEPFLHNDEEFITLKIKGQSFMYHQIRKMVGHLIALLKGIVPKDIQIEVWKEQKYSIPLAPSLGLVLEDVHFDSYNKKFGNDGIHEPLEWSEQETEVNSFRNFIVSNIIEKEIERKSYPFISAVGEPGYENETFVSKKYMFLICYFINLLSIVSI